MLNVLASLSSCPRRCRTWLSALRHQARRCSPACRAGAPLTSPSGDSGIGFLSPRAADWVGISISLRRQVRVGGERRQPHPRPEARTRLRQEELPSSKSSCVRGAGACAVKLRANAPRQKTRRSSLCRRLSTFDAAAGSWLRADMACGAERAAFARERHVDAVKRLEDARRFSGACRSVSRASTTISSPSRRTRDARATRGCTLTALSKQFPQPRRASASPARPLRSGFHFDVARVGGCRPPPPRSSSRQLRRSTDFAPGAPGSQRDTQQVATSACSRPHWSSDPRQKAVSSEVPKAPVGSVPPAAGVASASCSCETWRRRAPISVSRRTANCAPPLRRCSFPR